MRLTELRATRNPFKSLLILLMIYSVQYLLVWNLPFINWNLPWIWPVILMRLASMGSSLLLIWLLAPSALERFKFRIGNLGWNGFSGIATGLVLANLIWLHVENASIWAGLEAIVFSMFIGLDEEFFDRGIIFGFLERFGVEVALVISSLTFGLAHFLNYVYGHESLNYVIGHVIAASAMGYMFCSLMIASGTIWLPVLIHGLTDIRFVIMQPAQYDAMTSGNTDWPRTLISSALLILFSRILLGHSRGKWVISGKFRKVADYLGFIE